MSKLIAGSCYQVVSNPNLIERFISEGKYVPQPIGTTTNDPETGYIFRYLGKEGIHYIFREIIGGWTRTYTNAQLIEKVLAEVSDERYRDIERSRSRRR